MTVFWKTAAQLPVRHVRAFKLSYLISSIATTGLRKMSAVPTTSISIKSAPAAGQNILHEGKEYTTIKEGLAYILVPASAAAVPQTTPKAENQPQSVFYNPIQQFNRDLSVLAIKAHGEEVLEKKHAIINRIRKNQEAKLSRKRKRDEDQPAPGIEDQDTRKAPQTPAVPGETDLEVKGYNESSGLLLDMAVKEGKAETTNEPRGASSTLKAVPSNRPQPPPQPTFTILDALSATGLRAIRYAHEIPFATSVTANDLLEAATKSIKLNVEHNNLSDKIVPVTGNALTHMYSLAAEPVDPRGKPKPSKKYDVIDLDPYGTAAPFLDAAVQSVQDGGLLCVTCTDAGVWASNSYPEKSYSLYGGVPIKGQHSHEGGLRLILHAIATSAARYGLAIEPLLSLSIDFYARVFVRIKKSPAEVKLLAGKTMVVYNCDSGCGAWTTQLLARNKVTQNKSGQGTFHKHIFALGPTADGNCEHCGMKTHMAGPMYAGPIHTPSFVKRILDMLPEISKDTYQTTTRIEGMLSMALEETLERPQDDKDLPSPTAASEGKNDPAAMDEYPFFFIPSVISKVIHCVTPHENAMRGAIRNLGYRATRSHAKAGSIKTDAPWSVIWEIMREWVRQKSPIREGAIRKGMAGWKIMRYDEAENQNKSNGNGATSSESNKESSLSIEKREIVFDEELGKEKDKKKLVRYQLNPRENWGPMNRARGH